MPQRKIDSPSSDGAHHEASLLARIDRFLAQIAARDGRIDKLLAQVTARDQRVDELPAQVKTLNARIAELEAKLGGTPKTPDNSALRSRGPSR